MKEYIGRKMIEDGLMSKIILPKQTDGGLVCFIGELWFYFGGHEFELINPEDMPFELKVIEIKNVLDDFYEDACKGDKYYRDEYLYYYHYLCESI